MNRRPPTSLLFAQVKQHIFGVVFCMSGVLSDFSDVSPRLRELCEVMSPHLLLALGTGHLNMDYQIVQVNLIVGCSFSLARRVDRPRVGVLSIIKEIRQPEI